LIKSFLFKIYAILLFLSFEQSKNKRKHKKHKKNKEKDLGNISRTFCYITKAKNGCDNSNHKKNNGPS